MQFPNPIKHYISCNNNGISEIDSTVMKVKGNGQAKILTADELCRLFSDGFKSERDRCLFAICLYTGCRISEALQLQTTDLKSGCIVFRKSTTKGRLKTRVVDIHPGLEPFLATYQPKQAISGIGF